MSHRASFNSNLSSDSNDSDSDSNLNLSPTHIHKLRFNKKYSRDILFEDKLKSKFNNFKMPETSNVPVLKKEFIDMVPVFQGERELLPRFIKLCEKLVTKFYNAQDPTDFQNDYLMDSLMSKVQGAAAINISACVINSWLDLKTALLNTYADKRDCYTLNFEMCELKQESQETAFDFFNRVQHHLNLQIAYLTTHVNASEANVLTAYFHNFALKVLLRGLRNPIGSLLKVKAPESLNDALNILTMITSASAKI